MVYRCAWSLSDPRLMNYHDAEWGVPEFDEQKLFELLTLEIFQAGLSWLTVLKKRPAFRTAFDDFNYEKVSQYNKCDFERLINDAEIIRNQAKIKATIENARIMMKLKQKQQSLAEYIWNPTHYRPLNHVHNYNELLVVDKFVAPYMKQLKQLGFQRVGTTTVYSFLQAAGVVNDHEVNCYRYK